MAKLNREALAHYLDTTFKNVVGSAEWEIIGDDIEEMSNELNPDMETLKNILGQTKTKDNGYEPTMDADPFYADPAKKLYPKIREIAFDRLKGDSCKTLMLEVIVKPQSYGGDTAGLNIPFQVSEDGARTKGYVSAASLKTGNPEFTEGEIPGPSMLKLEKETEGLGV